MLRLKSDGGRRIQLSGEALGQQCEARPSVQYPAAPHSSPNNNKKTHKIKTRYKTKCHREVGKRGYQVAIKYSKVKIKQIQFNQIA